MSILRGIVLNKQIHAFHFISCPHLKYLVIYSLIHMAMTKNISQITWHIPKRNADSIQNAWVLYFAAGILLGNIGN